MAKKNYHEGHRDRLRKRFLSEGLDSFNDHEILELLMCYAVPRVNMNEKAHELMEQFKTFDRVFDASFEELSSVKGIGEITAVLIKLVPLINRRYQTEKMKISGKKLSGSREAGKYILPYFYAERDEAVYVITLDDLNRVIDCRLMCKGDFNSAAVNTRDIVRTALNDNAANVILAHNHPDGTAVPTVEDRYTTREIWKALHHVKIRLSDHIIVSDREYTSMSDSGYFDYFLGENDGF